MENLKNFDCFINESKNTFTRNDVDDFIKDVLKMGSKENLFDKFLIKEKIDQNELSDFIESVVDRIKEKWIV